MFSLTIDSRLFGAMTEGDEPSGRGPGWSSYHLEVGWFPAKLVESPRGGPHPGPTHRRVGILRPQVVSNIVHTFQGFLYAR